MKDWRKQSRMILDELLKSRHPVEKRGPGIL
jgi:hypothetical protein